MAAAPGTDITYTEDQLTSARQFANKMWNAARLLLMNMESAGVEPCIPEPAGQRLWKTAGSSAASAVPPNP